MHAMWKPQKFKYIYLLATLYVFTLTLPSASAVYWAFGDALLDHSNAFSLLPKNAWRDAAVILMLIHQVIITIKINLKNILRLDFHITDKKKNWVRSLSHLDLRARHCTSFGRR